MRIGAIAPNGLVDVMVSGANFMRIIQIEQHAAHIALVGNIVRIDLHCHRKPQLLRN